jgi:hypothetical protein
VNLVLENPRGFPWRCRKFKARGLGQESNPEGEAFCYVGLGEE